MMGNSRFGQSMRGMARPGAPTSRGGPGSIMNAFGRGGGGGGGGRGGFLSRAMQQIQDKRGGGQPQPDASQVNFNRNNPMPGGGSRMVTGADREARMGGGGGDPRRNAMQRQMAQAQGMRGGMGRSAPQRMGGGMKPQPPRGGMRPPNPTGGRARMGGRGRSMARGRGMYR